MVNWLGLVVPFAYLGILIGSLATFSSLYRKRKAARASRLEPWFGPHLQRNIYLTLLHMEPESGSPKVPDSVLKAALLQRATEDIRRIVSIRSSKSALSGLLQRGSVGDDLWQRFLYAEKEIEAELRDVVNEANGFEPNWGQVIFQTANEMANNARLRQDMEKIQAQAATEREWWDKRKAEIQSSLMKELEEESASNSKAPQAPRKGSEDDAVMVEAGGPSITTGKKKKKGKH